LKRAIIKVDWLFHSTDSLAVEKHCKRHPGVRYVEISPVSGVAIIEYDENIISLEKIQHMVIECGYHCRVFKLLDRGGEHGRT
jgi:Cu2+-exporting ATPase